MSKIICDVCGAAYPETSSRCPVCGSVHYGTPEPTSNATVTARRERDTSRASANRNTKPSGSNRRKKSKKNSPFSKYIAMGIALIVLLVILISMLVSSCDNGSKPTEPPVTTAPQDTTLPEIPCVGITLSVENVNLTEFGQSFRLTAICNPEDTTDLLTFSSSDPLVVTVDEVGELVAIGPGTAQITVTCGDAIAVCTVTCTMQQETEPPTLPPETLVLNRSDFTLSYKGATWQLYSGDIDKSLITFTSADETIATIVNGKVTAVGKGVTTVYAEYGDQKVSCIVRCSFQDDTTTDGNGGVQEDNGTSGTGAYTLWNSYGREHDNDASIKVGETVQLFLKDSAGNKITVEWTVSSEGIITIDGRRITGSAPGVVTVTGTHEGVTYSCVIRVFPAAEA
ncbi:MAG: hypothetical protein E7435_00200 [Ruminococcaceae bacterium]|nr:hypothetical protein [Oscillospiraceae bacterium]